MAICEYCRNEFGPTEGGSVEVERGNGPERLTLCDRCFGEGFMPCAVCHAYMRLDWTATPDDEILVEWYGDRSQELDCAGPAFNVCEWCIDKLVANRPPFSIARMEWRA